MPPLLGDIVRETLTTLDDVEVLADVRTRDEIGAAVRRTDAHVAVLGVSSRDPTGLSSLLGELLTDHPRLTVIALASDGRNGHVYQLQPSSVAIDNLTPKSLVETIRATSGMDVHPLIHPFSPD
jgi:DNA-binding NarL/FixJ family response regulator